MTIAKIGDYQELRRLRSELQEWRRRQQLCYDYDWADPCRDIIKSEIKRLRKVVEPDTILDKIANHQR